MLNSQSFVLLTGVTSVYWWEGKVEESVEQLMIIKTQTSLVDKLDMYKQIIHMMNVRSSARLSMVEVPAICHGSAKAPKRVAIDHQLPLW